MCVHETMSQQLQCCTHGQSAGRRIVAGGPAGKLRSFRCEVLCVACCAGIRAAQQLVRRDGGFAVLVAAIRIVWKTPLRAVQCSTPPHDVRLLRAREFPSPDTVERKLTGFELSATNRYFRPCDDAAIHSVCEACVESDALLRALCFTCFVPGTPTVPTTSYVRCATQC
ncbi:hypothetical protein TcBrA4_0005460 [Trypanosoma cruzi]|nr:hypothetical protein TcBrA4_0005460 [Trypanosoma cruzi]